MQSIWLLESIISIAGFPEEEGEGADRLFKKLIAEKFPNLQKERNIQVHEAKRTPNYFNAKWSTQDIILKFSKFNDKDRIFKTEKKNDNLQKNAHKLLTETLKDMREWKRHFQNNNRLKSVTQEQMIQ